MTTIAQKFPNQLPRSSHAGQRKKKKRRKKRFGMLQTVTCIPWQFNIKALLTVADCAVFDVLRIYSGGK